MSNTSQAQNSNTISGWDEAIAHVESELAKMKEYVTRLKAAKWVFLRSKANGTPWPGSIQTMMDKFDAGIAEQKKSPRRKARAVA